MAGIVDRVKNILLTPKTEWPVIDNEPGETKDILTYVAILAALPAIGGILAAVLGATFYPIAIPFAIVAAIVGYILAVVVIYLVAIIINALASTFSGEPHMPSALKLVGYSYTAAAVGTLFSFIPFLGWLISIAGGIYSAILLFLGLPVLMRAPQDKVVGYFIVALICAIVAWAVITIFVGGLLLLPFAFLALR